MFINGEWRAASSGKRFDSLNPATGEVVDSVPDGGLDDATAAIAAAAAAFPAWAGRTAYERSAILYKAWSLMMERKEDLARLMTTEQGKPLRAARNETQYAADFLLWYAEEAKRVYGETIPAPRGDQRFIIMKAPVGVVAAVTPWNYPISMLTRKLAPAPVHVRRSLPTDSMRSIARLLAARQVGMLSRSARSRTFIRMR